MTRWARGRRRKSQSPTSPPAPVPSPVPDFAEWEARFLDLMDEAATTACCSPYPNIVEMGQVLASARPMVREIETTIGPRSNRWPQHPLYIEGIRSMFEAVDRVLEMSLKTAEVFDDGEHQQLETDWNTSTLALRTEVTDLKSAFVMAMDQVGWPDGDGWLTAGNDADDIGGGTVSQSN